MNILLYTFFLLFITFITHLFMWRIRLPKNHTKVLLVLFFTVLVIGVAFYVFTAETEISFIPCIIQIVFLYVSITLAYITTYSALEVDSPSLVMIMTIAREGKSGLDKDMFYKSVGDDTLMIPRINDLLKGGLAFEEQGKIKITFKAKLFLKPILIYRKLIRMGKGG